MPRPSAFSRKFGEVNNFDCGLYVLSREHFSLDDASAEFTAYFEQEVKTEEIEPDWVRYQFAPEWSEFGPGASAWFICEPGKAAKPVWTFDPCRSRPWRPMDQGGID